MADPAELIARLKALVVGTEALECTHVQISTEDVYALLSALTAASPVPEGWRDIASAPRDAVVLLFTPQKFAWPVGRVDLDFAHKHTHATHWMPLPAPPSAKDETHG